MAGSVFGNIFKISTWGESHGEGLGVVIDGCPAGLPICEEDIQEQLDRRKPGQSKFTTPRKEDDEVHILSGVFEGKTTGTPISLAVYNKTQRSADYSEIANYYRPGHADYTFDERHKRTESIRELKFPYEYREGQKNLCVSVYRAIEDNTNLYIQAPTGVGKTLSTVFPAVQALGQQMADKIFYLTSKTITRTVAEDTYAILRDSGLHMRTVTLTAKDKICPLDERNCNPVACPYAKGHFDRINDAVYDIITSQMVIVRDNVMEYANRHKVCPFEMSLDVSYWCDGIICCLLYTSDAADEL